eukprot:3350591-Rhodomonas_salina.1
MGTQAPILTRTRAHATRAQRHPHAARVRAGTHCEIEGGAALLLDAPPERAHLAYAREMPARHPPATSPRQGRPTHPHTHTPRTKARGHATSFAAGRGADSFCAEHGKGSEGCGAGRGIEGFEKQGEGSGGAARTPCGRARRRCRTP